MKKLLSVSLIISGALLVTLLNGCNSNTATQEQAAAANSIAVSQILSIYNYESSLNVNSSYTLSERSCGEGGTYDGDYSVDESDGSISLTINFHDCAFEDSICDTGENLVTNGTLVIESNATYNGGYKLNITGNLDFEGMFNSSCEWDLTSTYESQETLVFGEPEIEGTICGYDYDRFDDMTTEEVCEAL